MQFPKTKVPELIWPAIPNQNGALLMSLQFQLEQSQWWTREKILTHQFSQLENLLRHAINSVPFYQHQMASAGINAGTKITADNWFDIPILERETLLKNQSAILSNDLDPSHGETFSKKTSGSTGRPLQITDTDANNLYWMAITLRDHLWHQRNFSGNMVAIRSGRYSEDAFAVQNHDNWGISAENVFSTGPCSVFYQKMPIKNQAELLQLLQPEYLLIYPSNAMRLTKYFRDNNLSLASLRGIMTYGELMLPEARSDCLDVWGVPIHDMYSCEELGYIALQCPEFEHYHCQSESVLVEVLDADGQPCQTGETGRLVLTSLHNFAMPFIRYANDDYAEVGSPCPCGRGSLVLKRLLGRGRNRAAGINGKLFWPEISREIWASIPGVEEIQMVQNSRSRIDVRVVGEPFSRQFESQLSEKLRDAFGQPFEFVFEYQNDILRHANGKYERFVRSFD